MSLRFLPVVLVASTVVASNVTPIEKVTQLMKGLQAKITEDGAREAKAYDKFACFCKEQATEKMDAIEKSDAKIAKLAAWIKAGNADIAGLNGKISKLSTRISGEKKQIKDNTVGRKKSHASYAAKAKDLAEAIGACEGAIESMKGAKGDLKDAKVDFAQIHSQLLTTASAYAAPDEALGLIEELGAPSKYTFQGNAIISLMENLLRNFKKMQQDMDLEEGKAQKMYAIEQIDVNQMKKVDNKEKGERAALQEAKTEDTMSSKEALDEEKKDRAADSAFLKTLTGECEEKAKLFDQRSTTRANELQAMTQAIEQLVKGVKPNEGANKKLAGSFLQIRRKSTNVVVKQVQALLQEAASNLDSRVLSNAAVRVMLSADHFKKVRDLIKDLIAKLKADAKSESKQKSFCDKAMGKATAGRDDGKSRQEKAGAKLATLTAQKEDLSADISSLAKAIAENKKGLNEATELRNDEKKENKETVASAKEGLKAVNIALSLLGKFYKNAFLQSGAVKYTPPKAGRDGKTVEDKAPEIFQDKYHGAQEESTGIIGMLEVISSDFERTIKQTTSDEKEAAEEFAKMKKETDADTKAKSDTSKKKEAALKMTKADILEQTTNHKDATKLFKTSVDKLDDLSASCVEGEETWKERAAARKKEISALKDAQKLLDDM